MTVRIQKLLNERVFLTSAGTETYLVFQQGFELPEFCAFAVHEDDDAWAELERNYIDPILNIAANSRCGLMLDALVWRAQPDFIAELGIERDQLSPINERAVLKTRGFVDRWRQLNGYDEESFPVLIVADVGPRGDGYKVDDLAMTAEIARKYHRRQIAALAKTEVDLVCALTMTTAEESIGIVQSAAECGLPIIVSPTVETDGRLPDGTYLGTFIQVVDDATGETPIYYMVNCAHPNHLLPTLEAARNGDEPWLSRFRGFRANASEKSHEELDNSTELDRGDLDILRDQVAQMYERYDLLVVGGCCGTDHEHLAAIASMLPPEGCRRKNVDAD